jgi:hypothetical protein
MLKDAALRLDSLNIYDLKFLRRSNEALKITGIQSEHKLSFLQSQNESDDETRGP